CEFVEIFHMSQPAISQHIKRLKDANLVNERRSGQWIIYSLNQDNENYFLLQDVLHHLPSQEDKLNWLEQQGFAIICERLEFTIMLHTTLTIIILLATLTLVIWHPR